MLCSCGCMYTVLTTVMSVWYVSFSLYHSWWSTTHINQMACCACWQTPVQDPTENLVKMHTINWNVSTARLSLKLKSTGYSTIEKCKDIFKPDPHFFMCCVHRDRATTPKGPSWIKFCPCKFCMFVCLCLCGVIKHLHIVMVLVQKTGIKVIHSFTSLIWLAKGNEDAANLPTLIHVLISIFRYFVNSFVCEMDLDDKWFSYYSLFSELKHVCSPFCMWMSII